VLPGTYNITVKANGYQTATVSGINVTAQSSTMTDIQLDPNENHGIYKVISSRIPDNNPSDPGLSWNVIGEPDNLYYSIGKNGWIVVDLQETIEDDPGPDLMVFEGDATPEGYTFYAGETMDGPWHTMGSGYGTSEFDFVTCDINQARYFKIIDDNDGQANVLGAGFDLDAIQVLSSITGPYIVMDGYYIDDSNGNNNGLLDPGETAPFFVTLKNVGTETALAVIGTFATEDEYLEIITTTPQPFGNLEVNQSAEVSFVVQASEVTPAGHTAIINLEIDGANMQPDTKFIAVNFPDFCYPSANCSWGDGFTGFSLESILNMNNGCSPNGYGDFTDMITELEPGETYTVGFETGYSNQDACLWIDFNNNMEFEDNERLVTDFNLANANQLYTTNIILPENIMPGEKRLRIRANWQNSSMDPCEDFSYGETEDYTVAIAGNLLQADFYVDDWEICHGDQVQYYDNSTGEIVSWEWTFPGGEPSSSTLQNPLITYNSPGFYGVTLTVSDGTNSSTQTMMEYILAHDDPQTPDMPVGQTELCQGDTNLTYLTYPANCTDWYWEINPSNAGTMTQTGPSIEIDWNSDFYGSVQLMVAGINECGQSNMSEPLNIFIQAMPVNAGLIDGPVEVCQEDVVVYTTEVIDFAEDYEWIITPAEAGSLSINETECTITFSDTFSGDAAIVVRGINDCGEGEWSQQFSVTVEICSGYISAKMDEHFLVYPNPASGSFNVKFLRQFIKPTTISLIDQRGIVVYELQPQTPEVGHTINFQLNDTPPGSYFLRFSDGTEIYTKKIHINQ
jgi:PKD repeat protein